MYAIIRYHRNGPSQLIKSGVTLDEAQEHCNDPSTCGLDWFDAYTEMSNLF